MLRSLLLLAIVPLLAAAQTTDMPKKWEPLRRLVGSWSGTGEGEPGSSA